MDNSLTCTFESVGHAFTGMGWHLLHLGKEVAPRGMKTLELHPITIEILDPTQSVVLHPDRKMNYEFMALEPIWILSGDDEPWIINHLKNLDRFTDIVDGKKRLMGAYGPRIRKRFGVDQLQYVINTLKKDPDSRQATIVIADPSTDTKGYRDVSCTQWMQFLIRNGKLDMTVLMRSNDIWLGYCYDAFTFTFMQHLLASILGIPVGRYYHMVNSFHIYEQDIPKLRTVLDFPRKQMEVGVPPLSTMDYSSLDEAYRDAEYGKPLSETGEIPGSRKYVARLLEFSKSQRVEKVS